MSHLPPASKEEQDYYRWLDPYNQIASSAVLVLPTKP